MCVREIILTKKDKNNFKIIFLKIVLRKLKKKFFHFLFFTLTCIFLTGIV